VKLNPSSELVVDFETTGLNVLANDFKVVGVAIANDKYPHGIYTNTDYTNTCNKIMTELTKHKLIAHNVGYDARVLEGYLRQMIDDYVPMSRYPWTYDTLLVYKSLANEGYAGQSWSLKEAQKDVLGWSETNEVELDEWLVGNGYIKKSGKPDKGQMWRAPTPILGFYGGLDAQSTWALWKYFQSYLDRFPDLRDIMGREFVTLSKLEVEEFFHGLRIDTTKLDDNITNVKSMKEWLLDQFFNNSEATPFIKQYNDNILFDYHEREPEQFTKAGKVSSRYTKWKEKLEDIENTQHFNPNSKDQLAWLFYDCLYKTTPVEPVVDWRGNTLFKFNIIFNGERILLNGTPGGKRKIDKQILPKLGKAGRLLTRYNELVKLLGYMEGMRKSLVGDIHHTNLRLYGTLTGRCAGSGGVNIQQLPKVREYLDCLVPRPGHVFIQMDVDALEPVVLAELSEDRSMMALYGPDAKPNDIYLFVGASIPALRDEVCQYGYDPFNPTAEAIAITKKKAKRIRSICKVLHLSAGYGAGAKRIHETLVQSGIDITLDAVRDIHKAYWELFGGVTAYQDALKSEYHGNGGWFMGGRGQPITVAGALEKDILNRQIQNTGHVNLLTYLYYLDTIRSANRHVSIVPIVTDFHDECIFEVPEKQAKIVMQMFRRTWSLTNDELDGIIPLSGEPEICVSFSDFKCEGGYKLEEIKKEFEIEC
jgi:hypothetical protein